MKKYEKLNQVVNSDNENILEILNDALNDLENLDKDSSLNEINNNTFVIENDFYNSESSEQNFSYFYNSTIEEETQEDWIDDEIDYFENKYLGFNKNEKKILIH